MEYHLDHQVRLDNKSEHKPLYAWSLQEFTNEGTRIGPDQIPWPWSIYFTASGLVYSKTIELERQSESAADKRQYKSAQETDFISAKLRSGFEREENDLEDEVTFSMFGTQRTVDNFSLRITRLNSDDNHEKCHVWGSVGYTTDIDFSDVIVDDMVQISIVLSPDRFERLRQMLTTQRDLMAQVRLNGVSGFYSEWSPSISTDSVKILTADTEHVVTIPDGCGITPPRLGTVQGFSLAVTERPVVASNKDSRSVAANRSDQWTHESEAIVSSAQDVSVLPADSEASALFVRTLRAISRLFVPLWLIVILLILLLFK